MQKLWYKFTDSVKKMKQVKMLTAGGMLVALYVLSSFFLQFYPSPSVKIGVGFLFIATAGYLYGPIMGMIVGGLGDFVTWLIQTPGAFNPGITLSMAVMGLVFGLFYYNEKPTLPRCILACVSETVLVELLMKSYFLSLVYGTTMMAQMALRLLSATIMLAIMIVLTYFFFKAIEPFKARLEQQSK